MTETRIYKFVDEAEYPVGFVDENGAIRASRGASDRPLGRVAQGVIFRATAHDERELGYVDDTGRVFSHGLFEGGEIGWVDPDGVVVRAGLIFGETEVGRVEGPANHAAGAALLLLFLPDDEESSREAART